MNTLDQQFAAFIESTCRRVHQPDMAKKLINGYMALCEARGDWSETNDTCFPLVANNWEQPNLFAYDYTGNDSHPIEFVVNVCAWIKLANLAQVLTPEEIITLSDELSNLTIDEFGYASIEIWESPSQYFEDPGDGGANVSIIGLPNANELQKQIETELDALIDNDADSLAKPGVKEKLMSVIPQMAAELQQYDGKTEKF